MITTVDNFNSNNRTVKKEKEKKRNGFSFNEDNENYFFNSTATSSGLNVCLKDYQSKTNNTFFSFFKDEDKKNKKNQDDLIISIHKNGEECKVQTGNYVGKFVWDNGSKHGLKIDIKSRFSNVFLSRMLNFANNIFLDNINVAGGEVNEIDTSKFIIYYLFIQNLEKAFLLGLPKAYRSIQHHDMKLKGKIDINRFIKHDIPFKGKIASISREQREIQEIIDVLYKAVSIIDKSEFSTKNISHIKTHLKQNRSKQFVTNQTIKKALNSKALQNPIFAGYKKVLEYAKFIINGDNIKESDSKKHESLGFLINVAELFEIYVSKLLQKEFPGWSVDSPQHELYEGNFFARKIIPDIVMTNGNKIIVFDAKYKRMNFTGRNQNGAGDLDRADFFQINTYMSYYQNQSTKNYIIAGGLLYPIETTFNENLCHSQSWFGDKKTKFIVDGIDLSKLESVTEKTPMELIKESEDEFIQRIKNLLIQSVKTT